VLAETFVFSVALGVATTDRAEFRSRSRVVSTGPHSSFTVFKKRPNALSRRLRVEGQLAVFPTGKPLIGANPKTPIARGNQGSNVAALELLTGGRLPLDLLDTIEPKQTEFRAQPEVPVLRLSNCDDRAFGKAIADLPRCVCVLAHVERRIQRERAALHQQQTGQHGAKRDSASSLSMRSPHHADIFILSRLIPPTNVIPSCSYSMYAATAAMECG